MFKHPLTVLGGLAIGYAVVVFFSYLSTAPTERSVAYVGAYISLAVGAFCLLIGIIIQGFRRLERLIIFRDMEAMEADGIVGNVWDSSAVRKAHLKAEKR